MAKMKSPRKDGSPVVNPPYGAEWGGEKIDHLMYHYNRVRQDMDTRRTRKNGWNEVVSAYMGRLPANWPFIAKVTDPRMRGTILEKTARLLNAKLEGRLVPRNTGNVISAEIMNQILSFNWDAADHGGSMIEKVALADQTTRMFGACYALTYWNNVLNINDIKVLDQRDVGFDGAATHARNARWMQVREFTTWDKLEERGYKVGKWRAMAKEGSITSQYRSTSYEDIVKANRGLQDRVGEVDDPINPIVEVITEWTPNDFTIFLPRIGVIVDEGKNPYKHGKIPVAQLRYYPLGTDIYGESEVESVLPLQRAINAILCAFLDEATINMRPPLKVSSSGVRIETIQYGPGALWIMQNPNLVQEMTFSPQVINAFNATYPALVAAYNTAMGDQSLAISQMQGKFTEKTATEVNALARQQNNRDQYNQLYLGEFLKDIMMMWVSNIKQYLFDDPSKNYHIMKIIGQDQIDKFKQMKLSDMQIPDYAITHIASTIQSVGGQIPPAAISQIMNEVQTPVHPIVTNPEEKNPVKFKIKPKLEISPNGREANLYVTREDLEGEYDYIPDVRSMAAGTIQMIKDARQQAFTQVVNPVVQQLLSAEGVRPKMKELLVSQFEDAGLPDAEGLFEPIPQQPPMQGQPNQGPQQLPVPNILNGQAQAQPPGSGANPGMQQPPIPGPVGGVPPVPKAVPPQAVGGGLPPT